MIGAWRLTRRIHATPPARAYDGTGAHKHGGRWNPMGTRAAYASATRSLAALEYLANVDASDLPRDLVFVGVSFSEADVTDALAPAGWDSVDSEAAIRYGDDWLRSQRSLALCVPSVIVKAERNYVLNPIHARAPSLAVAAQVEEFIFDERLL